MKHKTKDGKLIDLKDLELDHLNNIINWIERKAEEGILIEEGGGGVDIESMWYYEYTIYGQEVKDHFNYKAYKKELKRRTKLKKEISIKDFFQSINYSLLQEQKKTLLSLLNENLKQAVIDDIDGITCFIDSIQDLAVDKLGYEESLVFNSKEDDSI